MKIMKNKFFKIASLMIMLCLISTCAIGTTFAKYVTGDTATDSARVAKWGVRLEMQGDDLFRNEYATDDSAYAGSLSVKSSSTSEDVVAPGTKGSTVFSIKGTPEVAANIKIEFDGVKDIVLPAGNAGLTEDYHPLVFTLKQTHDYQGEMATPTVLFSGTLAQIEAALANFSANYAPNTILDSTYELSWEWAFENAGKDAADTLLGDIIAGEATVAGAVTEVEYDLSITVTQID